MPTTSDASHLSLSIPPRVESATAEDLALALQGKLWRPRRVLITRDAYALKHGQRMLERAAALGAEVFRLPGNRLTLNADTEQQRYALAKTTFAIVVSPPSQRKLQPIPPSADWQFHVAQGCPAHCQYCYLAGSLSGPPVTRAYADLPEILDGLRNYVRGGQVTSKSRLRSQEGPTFEASCYTDPLGVEHLTGALEASIQFFGDWDAPVQLRWTTKFDAVARLLRIQHHMRTRARFSINAGSVARDFEGGTANVYQRLHALRAMAMAGYPVGLSIAPIMPVPDWQQQYSDLLTGVAQAVRDIKALDLTVEMITHRFTLIRKKCCSAGISEPRLTCVKMSERRSARNSAGLSTFIQKTSWVKCAHSYMEA